MFDNLLLVFAARTSNESSRQRKMTWHGSEDNLEHIDLLVTISKEKDGTRPSDAPVAEQGFWSSPLMTV